MNDSTNLWNALSKSIPAGISSHSNAMSILINLPVISLFNPLFSISTTFTVRRCRNRSGRVLAERLHNLGMKCMCGVSLLLIKHVYIVILQVL